MSYFRDLMMAQSEDIPEYAQEYADKYGLSIDYVMQGIKADPDYFPRVLKGEIGAYLKTDGYAYIDTKYIPVATSAKVFFSLTFHRPSYVGYKGYFGKYHYSTNSNRLYLSEWTPNANFPKYSMFGTSASDGGWVADNFVKTTIQHASTSTFTNDGVSLLMFKTSDLGICNNLKIYLARVTIDNVPKLHILPLSNGTMIDLANGNILSNKASSGSFTYGFETL